MSTPQRKLGRVRVPTAELGMDPQAIGDAIIRTFVDPEYQPPLLPNVALELHRLANKPDVAMSEITSLLSRDPMLAARVLRVAQSADLRGVEGVRSIQEAAVRIGLGPLADLFLETAMAMRVFQAPGFDAPMEELRAHSVRVARSAKLLAASAGLEPSQAFLVGLLHDIGYAAGLIAVSEGRRAGTFGELPWPLVRMALDSVHTDAGRVLGRLWSLPEEIVGAIEHHHRWRLGDEVFRAGALLSVIEAAAAPKHETVSEGDPIELAMQILALEPSDVARAWEASRFPLASR